MGVLTTILLVLFVGVALLLVLMVLMQDDQGDGLGGIFGGGGGGGAPFGTRSGNVLTRFTAVLGALFMIISLSLAFINRTPEDDDVLGTARQEAQDEEDQAWWQESQDDEALPEDVDDLELPEAESE